VFTSNEWGNEIFHLTFLSAAFLSLIGMVLTLQHHEHNEEDEAVDVQKVGQSGWFTAVIGSLLLGVALICTLLFLPTVRNVLYEAGKGGFGVLKWLFNKAVDLIVWLFSLLPSSDTEGIPPEMMPADPAIAGEMSEEALFSLPIEWIIAIIGVIITGIVIFML